MNKPKFRSEDGIVWGILIAWVVFALLAVGIDVAIIWAIVKLVLHFT